VRVSYDEAQVRLTIRNTPPASAVAGTALAGRGSGPAGSGPALAGPGSALAGTGSGLGIASLRQRIELVHGTLRAGRSPDGGFCLEATLPAYVPTADSAV
jgi:hypothetical protein